MKTLMREIKKVSADPTRTPSEWVEQVIDKQVITPKDEILRNLRFIGWTVERLPERDTDGFEFYQLTFREYGKGDTKIVGYKEVEDAS